MTASTPAVPPLPLGLSLQTYYDLSNYSQQVSLALVNGTTLPTPPAGWNVLTDTVGLPIVSNASQISDGFAAVALVNGNNQVVILGEGSLLQPVSYTTSSALADLSI